jgi:hypothetical protein
MTVTETMWRFEVFLRKCIAWRHNNKFWPYTQPHASFSSRYDMFVDPLCIADTTRHDSTWINFYAVFLLYRFLFFLWLFALWIVNVFILKTLPWSCSWKRSIISHLRNTAYSLFREFELWIFPPRLPPCGDLISLSYSFCKILLLPNHLTLAVTATDRYCTRRTKHCDHFLIYCAFSIRVLIIPDLFHTPEGSSSCRLVLTTWGWLFLLLFERSHATDFYLCHKSIVFSRVWTREPWVHWQAR